MMSLSLSLGSLFEAYVKKVMYTYDASGIAVAIVDREQPVRELFFGFRDQEQKRLIDQDTIFGLASHQILYLPSGLAAGATGKS